MNLERTQMLTKYQKHHKYHEKMVQLVQMVDRVPTNRKNLYY